MHFVIRSQRCRAQELAWALSSVQYNLLIFIAANDNNLHLHIVSQRPDNNREKG